MFRIVLRVENVPVEIGATAATYLTTAFLERPWQKHVRCVYERGGLTFTAENDFDENGLATQDEFAHEFANVPIFDEDDGNLSVVSIEEF